LRKNILTDLGKNLLFLMAADAFLLVMLCLGDGLHLVSSAKYYIWMIVPLFGFGTIYVVVSTLYRHLLRKAPEGGS